MSEPRQLSDSVQLAPFCAKRAGCRNVHGFPFDGAMRSASSVPCQSAPRFFAAPDSATAPMALRASPSKRRSSTAPRASSCTLSSTVPTSTARPCRASSPLPLRQGRRPRRLSAPALQSFQRRFSPPRSASMSGAVRAPVSAIEPASVPLAPGARSARFNGRKSASTSSVSPTLPLAVTRLPPSESARSPWPLWPSSANVPRASSGRSRRRPASFGTSSVPWNWPSSRWRPLEVRLPERLPFHPAAK